jgi:hypothetical protein
MTIFRSPQSGEDLVKVGEADGSHFVKGGHLAFAVPPKISKVIVKRIVDSHGCWIYGGCANDFTDPHFFLPPLFFLHSEQTFCVAILNLTSLFGLVGLRRPGLMRIEPIEDHHRAIFHDHLLGKVVIDFLSGSFPTI